MKQKSWHLNRKTLLQSGAIALALPWLECMSQDTKKHQPKRFFAGYFPYGVPIIEDDDEHRMHHGWFPLGVGKDYKMTDMHQSLESLRDNLTFVSGLSHASMRKTSAHKGADVFLTGAQILNSYGHQSVSIDQVIAQKVSDNARYKSLVLSSMGGVNRPYRTSTLSFDRSGNPIPSQNNPKEIFRRLFGKETQSEKNALTNRSSILDELMRETKSLNRKLGVNDQKKVDEYMSSIRSIEKMTERAIQWQNVSKPKVDDSELNLDLNASDAKDYIDLMYELVILAFQTDSTRVSTFQVGAEASSLADRFPSAVGIKKTAHSLSHESKEYSDVAKYLTFLNERYSEFLNKLKTIQEGEGNLLDNTMCFYGCATSKTHRPINYPIILAGGKNIGFKHGEHKHYIEESPLSNLFLTIAKKYDPNVQKFADSEKELTEYLS